MIFFSEKILDPIENFIEDVITDYCYEGQPYVKIKSKTELKLEKAHQERKKNKKESLYEKMKVKYELELFSEAELLLSQKQAKKFGGTFFDTKAEQQDYFECICGSDLEAEDDRKFRVQCTQCGIYQHAECVR